MCTHCHSHPIQTTFTTPACYSCLPALMHAEVAPFRRLPTIIRDYAATLAATR